MVKLVVGMVVSGGCIGYWFEYGVNCIEGGWIDNKVSSNIFQKSEKRIEAFMVKNCLKNILHDSKFDCDDTHQLHGIKLEAIC